MAISRQSAVLRDTFGSVRHIVSYSVIMSFVYGLLKLAGPLFMILIFNQVLPSRSTPTLTALLLLLVTIIAVMALLDYSRRRILARFGAQFQERIEDHLLGTMGRDAFARRGSKPAEGLNEADQLRSFFHSGSLVTILDFMWSPVFLAVVFLIAPMVGWVVVAGLILLVIINTVRSYFEKGRGERNRLAGDRIKELKEKLQTSRHVIESQQMMGTYNQRWMQARRHSRDAAVELRDWDAWFGIMSSHTATMIQYMALAAGAYLTIQGQLTIGAMVACMYLTRFALHPTERFLRQVPKIREAREHWKNLDRTLSAAKPPVATVEGVEALHLSQLMVRCPITKNKLLRNINIDIAPGTAVEIIGPAGSGKTVLAETLVGRFPRAGGNVLLGTISLNRLSLDDAARMIGYVPQQVDFISGTIAENIAGLDSDPDLDRIAVVADLAGVHHRILSLPEGYSTEIDPVGSIFSKSERHQLALARALYPDPQLIIVDEPDGSFKAAQAGNLQEYLSGFLARGGILIVLAEKPLGTHHATRRFLLANGELREAKLDRASESNIVRVRNGAPPKPEMSDESTKEKGGKAA